MYIEETGLFIDKEGRLFQTKNAFARLFYQANIYRQHDIAMGILTGIAKMVSTQM